MFQKTIVALSIFLSFCSVSHAQWYTNFSHEVGAIAGPVAFQSDYGERYDFDTNKGNTGVGVGLVHYINFSYIASCRCYAPYTYFNDHFKLRSELSYNRTELKHFGRWVDKDNGSLGVQQLRAMRGSAEVINLGMQLEYFPWSIRNFTASVGSFGPYVSLGAQYSFYNPEAYSTMGPLGSPTTTFPKYLDPSDGRPHGYTSDSGNVWSIVGSIGSRYKMSPMADLLIDLRLQYYYSNWVDGLSPDPNKYPENKANDWLVWLNVGYIYYID
jgi:hypothetical protein